MIISPTETIITDDEDGSNEKKEQQQFPADTISKPLDTAVQLIMLHSAH